MLAQVTSAILGVCMALVGSLQHAGHLCEIEGPVMGSDCCCANESTERATQHDSEVDVPGCCDGLTDVSSHEAVNASEHEILTLSFPLSALAEPSRGVFRYGHSQIENLRLRAPPDPPSVATYLRNQTLLI